MPQPKTERQRLEQERAELPGQIIARLGELAETPVSNRARRERIEWQIRRDEKRLAEIEAGLAAGPRWARMTTRAQQAGLHLKDVPRPSLAALRRQHRLDAKVRQALGLVLRRRRPKG
jgi:predicted transcriptional regulator